MEAQGEVKHNGRKEGRKEGGEWKINKVRRQEIKKSQRECCVECVRKHVGWSEGEVV